ncbi:hypothetical protein [Polaribacter sp. Hel_I_88]|uniref:hypothetical protein n=1 Tax=Polaribacter sp. Hel_I_88 TaxID=1250006 RepID=UPI00047B02D2|nr:hypothetical protein [Polaribacter sp. Hel_I_88]
MKHILQLLLLLFFSVSFSQKKVVKKLQTFADEITIYTAGLDNLVLENSTSEFIEVTLFAESYDDQLIKIEEKNKELFIKFDFEGTQTREVVFRKFITKRLQRANAVVKIPKGKKVFIFGENVDIESKSHQNELAIYIENGIVKLNEIKAKTTLKLYSGNVYASVKNTNLDINSKDGKIEVDEVLYEKTLQKKLLENTKDFSVTSLKANIFLTDK